MKRLVLATDPALVPAIEQLRISKEIVDNNAPINRLEGNLPQARLEEDNSESYDRAIKVLESAKARLTAHVKPSTLKSLGITSSEHQIAHRMVHQPDDRQLGTALDDGDERYMQQWLDKQHVSDHVRIGLYFELFGFDSALAFKQEHAIK